MGKRSTGFAAGFCVVALLLTGYVASYFGTSRVILVPMTAVETRPMRLFDSPWQDAYRPLAAFETAVRPGFGVMFRDR